MATLAIDAGSADFAVYRQLIGVGHWWGDCHNSLWAWRLPILGKHPRDRRSNAGGICRNLFYSNMLCFFGECGGIVGSQRQPT
jgi:hypothetical protein